MPTRDGPIFPPSVNVVRNTLLRSDVATLHDPEIAVIDRCDYFGWVRYSACVSIIVASRYPGRTLHNAVFYAFCEPLSDFQVKALDAGLGISFTLYVNRDAALLRRDDRDLTWEVWAEKYRA